MSVCKYYSIDEFSRSKFNASRSFSIFHLNIHSIQLHIEDLRIILQLLEFKFDIIAISESKLQKGLDPKIDISLSGYQNPISTPTEANKGGVLIYVTSNLNVKLRNDLDIYKSKELESVFIEIINPKETNSIVGVIYRHPCMDPTLFNDEFFNPLLTKLSKESNKKIFLTGDFNFDLLKVSSNDETSNFFDSLSSNLLLPYYPDFVTGNLSTGLSDHLPSFVIIPKPNQIHLPKKHNFYQRNQKGVDRIRFLQDIKSISWEIIDIDKSNVDHSFSIFMSEITKILDKHMPYKKLTNKQFKRKYKPWITEGIIQSIQRKNSLFNKYMKCKETDLKKTYHSEYKLLKNRIIALIRNSKESFYRNYFSRNTKNLRNIWKGIKEVINVKSKQLNQPSSLQVDDVNNRAQAKQQEQGESK